MPQRSLASSLFGISKIFAILLAVSLSLFAYKRALLPLYGTVPLHDKLSYVLFAALAIPAATPRLPTLWALLMFGVLLCAAPNSTYWVAVLTARLRDPVWGPVVTHAVALAPIIYAASSCVMDINISPVQDASPGLFDRVIMLQAIYSLSTVAADYLWPNISYPGVSDSKIFLTVGGSAIAVWALAVALSLPEPSTPAPEEPSPPSPKVKTKTRSKAAPLPPVKPESNLRPSESLFTTRIVLSGLLLALLPVLLPYLQSPVLSQPLEQPYTHPTLPLRILSSTQSTTGLVVVGEILPPPPSSVQNISGPTSIRYLRASHSLLGGVWIGNKVATKDNSPAVTDQEGTPLGDSIYSAFVLQEGARLVSSTMKGMEEQWESALIIGLGAGIVASAFERHHISTTIVEIDPAVYNASLHFFGLPDLGVDKVHLEDARGWVTKRRNTSGKKQTGLFDIVVHDCFSGGEVPAHLFTVQFWDDLKSIVHPDGVVSVNFAGSMGSEGLRAVLFTLQRSFGQCRAFHDNIGDKTEDELRTEYLNIVFFCTPSREPLTFRPARNADYLNSYLREHVLSSLLRREIDLDVLKGAVPVESQEQWILTDQNNMLGGWQKKEAFEHWKVMRNVLPDFVWETY